MPQLRRSHAVLAMALAAAIGGSAAAATLKQENLKGAWSGTFTVFGAPGPMSFTVDAAGNITSGTINYGSGTSTVTGHLTLTAATGTVSAVFNFPTAGFTATGTLTLSTPGLSGKPHRLTGTVKWTTANASETIDFSGGTAIDPPPTVAAAAAAAPNPVTGATTALSVLGADNGGESNLKYTWSLVSGPSSATFSANGTNTAKNVTATFSKVGTFVLRVTIKDVPGGAVTSNVSVTVTPTQKSLVLLPAGPSVVMGESRLFHVEARDQFDALMSTAPLSGWTVSGGGTISSAGLFSATTLGGPFTVSVHVGATTASTTIRVVPNSPPVLVSGPTFPHPAIATRPAGFSAAATDANGHTLSYTWEFGDGTSASGSACQHTYMTPGTYSGTLTISDGKDSLLLDLTVTVAPFVGQLLKTHAKLRLNFAVPGQDRCTVQSTLVIPISFDFEGAEATLDVGGATFHFLLNGRGQGVSPEGKLSLRPARWTWSLRVNLTRSALAEALADNGLADESVLRKEVMLPVTLTLDHYTFTTTHSMEYSATAGQIGSAKTLSP